MTGNALGELWGMYHWAPFQNDRGKGPWHGACGKPVQLFYVRASEFLSMEVPKCRECEDLLGAGVFVLSLVGVKAALTLTT